MIDKFFIGLINMSITASLIILVVLLVRLVLRKAPKIFSYVLWFVVLFRLICPFSFSSAYSLLGFFQSGVESQGISWQADETLFYDNASGNIAFNTKNNNFNETEINETVINQTNSQGSVAGNKNDATDANNSSHITDTNNSNDTNVVTDDNGLSAGEVTETVSENKIFLKSFIFVGEIVWLVGVAGLTIYTVFSYIHLRKRVKSAVNIERNVYTSENIDMPFVMGIIKPRIYMPDIKGTEYDYILLHERTHIRRCDDVVKLVAFIALCIHWFNPLVWLAFFLMVKDMEMSCDEAVVRQMGASIKKDYSTSLLKMASGRNRFDVTPLAFGENSIKRRIKNVLSYKKPAVYIIAMLAIACTVLAVLLISNPKNKDSENLPEENYVAEEASSEEEDEKIETEAETDIEIEAEINIQTEATETDGMTDEEIWDARVKALEESDKGTPEHVIVKDEYRTYTSEMGDYSYNDAMLWDVSKKDNNAEVQINLDLGGGFKTYYAILEFSEDCVFKVNYEFSQIKYEETDLDTVLGCMKKRLRLSCHVTIKDNKITEILLPNVTENVHTSGVSGEVYEPYNYYSIDRIKEENVLEQCTLLRTEYADVSERAGMETLEIYGGHVGYVDQAFLVVRDTEGEIIYVTNTVSNWAVRDGIYLGEKDDESFLMNFYIEERAYGECYSYSVFRLDENGSIINIARSRFSIDINGDTLKRYPYDEDILRKWVEVRDIYFKNCYSLVIEDAEVVSAEKVYDADRFTFDAINYVPYNEYEVEE